MSYLHTFTVLSLMTAFPPNRTTHMFTCEVLSHLCCEGLYFFSVEIYHFSMSVCGGALGKIDLYLKSHPLKEHGIMWCEEKTKGWSQLWSYFFCYGIRLETLEGPHSTVW
jgi:hypothetical protein